MSKVPSNMTDRLTLLASRLQESSESVEKVPSFEGARKVCMDARALFSAFEEEAVLADSAIEESSRTITLSSLEQAKDSLEQISSEQFIAKHRVKFIQIMLAMAERVELTRYSTRETIRQRLKSYASKFTAGSAG